MALLKILIETDSSLGQSLDPKETVRKGFCKATCEAVAIAVEVRRHCSEYKLIKFRLTFLCVRFPPWSC